MWLLFSLENMYFALHVFSALTMLAVAWLYYDAWSSTKHVKELLRVVGFIALAGAFVFRGMDLQGIVVADALLNKSMIEMIDLGLRVFGYVTVVLSLIIDPLQPRPTLAAFFLTTLPFAGFTTPVLAGVAAVLYLRRASIGLERHITSPSLAFFLFSLYELLIATNWFRGSQDIRMFQVLEPFGVVWIAQCVVLLLAILVLAKWVFGYLLRQFQTQLFMILMSLVLGVFLFVTVGFTGLLMNNLKLQLLQELKSQASILDFALQTKREQLMSDARLLGANAVVVTGLQESGASSLAESIAPIFAATKHDSLIVFDKDGTVRSRAEDRERTGDSLANDVLVKQILEGKEASTTVVKDGAVAPTVSIISGVPLMVDDKVIGGALVGERIDSAWIEGFSKLTGLRVAIYGGDTLSAMSGDDLHTTSLVGVKETRQQITENVLVKGRLIAEELPWLNTGYLSVYSPMKDVEQNPVGMFFVGRPLLHVLNLAGKTLEMVFGATILLLFLSMIPAKIIAKSITNQIK